MTDLLALSRAVIDDGKGTDEIGPINRINHELSVIGDGIAVVEAFSHCVLFETGEGLVAFDTSNPHGGQRVVEAIRQWRDVPFHTIVYTHGHVDHVGGCGAFIADARARGHRRPRVAGHENVPRRFDRYNLTNGYNQLVNERQFGQFRRRGYDIGGSAHFLPESSPKPDVTYQDTLQLEIGGPGDRAAAREGRDRRSHVGLDSAAPGHLRRRFLHLELSERG
jgi:glyoxylase-like metal-dependent hydrolase (beta-lactamase superfamily II)